MRPYLHRALAVAGALVLAAPALRAQSRIFPAVPRYELPLADPRAWAFGARYVHVSTADDRFGPGTEAEVLEGENFPLILLKGGARPISLGFGASVVAHFRMDDPKTSQISDDWLVGLNGQFVLSPKWTVVAEVMHESSHLGDEYALKYAADSALQNRVDWTRMQLNGWGFYTSGRWRIGAGLHYVYSDELHLPKTGVGLGMDYRGPVFRVLGQPTQVVGGVFTEGWGQTDWRFSRSARLGVSFPDGDHGWRRLSLALAAYSGPSTQRQFYTQQLSYVGMELRFDL